MKKLLLLLCFPMSVLGQINAEKVTSYLDSVMKARHIPGISVAIIQNSKTRYIQSLGSANLETNTLVTNESVFQLASLTKPFTAVCMMQLVEQGKIDLKNSITKYIDSLPESYKLITVENLLTHTAGFQDQVNLVYDNSPVMDVSTKKQLEIILQEPLLFAPGESCSYADPGYFLLGMIIEETSGLKYKDYLEQNIFKPLGMEHSLVENRWAIIENRVAPYRFINNELINGRRDYQHELPSHFGILSTVSDLIKWDLALRNKSIISSSSLNQMWTPAALNNGNDALAWGINYGYGWMLGDIKGYKYGEHGGFAGTHLLHFIDEDLSIIVLTNLDLMSKSNPRNIAHHLAGIILETSIKE